MRDSHRRLLLGVALLLPLLLAILTDQIAGSASSSGAVVSAMIDAFFASIVIASGMIAWAVLASKGSLLSRMALLVGYLVLILIEAACTALWLVRGAH